ncbi:hypothetical protein GH714_039034 [Hevea brasiliensis]|uniref:Anthocyanidin 3-O-glucosyltransferase n=1 Tax=Hevea brasiliensis TaxID=3981 RepID=A0A6A6KLQ6_HEVBR|nr:hypothetical protein GH714_039034 [Hevea brasiliensis]
MESLIHVFPAYVDDFVGKLALKKPQVTCLIADTFFVWPSKIPNKYNLVNVSFWTEPALVLTIHYHLDLLNINGHYGRHDNREDAIDYIPGVGSIEPKDLRSYLQAPTTVKELEPKTISALQEKQPFHPIASTFLLNGFQKATAANSLWSYSDCIQWLQTKPHGSVLYVSFGSLAFCSREDLAEVAHGLLLSKVSFIWVLRPGILDSDDTDFLPVGFEEEMKDRGFVVPWCCQISVISHPTVGGFLTDCGWNSILETIWFNVPMLCYPPFTDQITNRKLVVDDWKIGLNLCDRKPIRRDESQKISTV